MYRMEDDKASGIISEDKSTEGVSDYLTAWLNEMQEELVRAINQGGASTQITEWLRSIQEELARVIEGCGISLDARGHDQLESAIMQRIDHAINALREEYLSRDGTPNVFYGLRLEGKQLQLHSGVGEFRAADYPCWMIASGGLNFRLGVDGHLTIVFS